MRDWIYLFYIASAGASRRRAEVSGHIKFYWAEKVCSSRRGFHLQFKNRANGVSMSRSRRVIWLYAAYGDFWRSVQFSHRPFKRRRVFGRDKGRLTLPHPLFHLL